MEIKNSYMIYIAGGAFPTERPEAESAYIIHWADAGVVIPWPKGLTAREAILEWAKNEIKAK